LTRTEVLYARATKVPDNVTGIMRLADRKVRVVVEGSDRVGEFRTIDPQGYMLIHEADLSRLIENTRKLLELKDAR
jgi:hypothetical protein